MTVLHLCVIVTSQPDIHVLRFEGIKRKKNKQSLEIVPRDSSC